MRIIIIQMLMTMRKGDKIKKILKLTFSGFSILFLLLHKFLVGHDTMTEESSNTAEYCAKYGF